MSQNYSHQHFGILLEDNDSLSQKQRLKNEIVDLSLGSMVTKVLYVATKYELFDHLSAGTLTVAALSKAMKMDDALLHSILIVLNCLEFVSYKNDQVFLLDKGKMLLKENKKGLRNWVLFWGKTSYDVWANIDEYAQTGRIEKNLYRSTAVDSEQYKIYIEAMRETEIDVRSKIIDHLPINQETKVVLEIGGGHGEFLTEITKKYQHIQPYLIDMFSKEEKLEKQNITFINGDCTQISSYNRLPRADFIVIKQLLEDLSDSDVVKTLENCTQIMDGQSELGIIEIDFSGKYNCMAFAFVDLQMRLMTSGKQRSKERFSQLASKAGLTLDRILPTGTYFDIKIYKKSHANK